MKKNVSQSRIFWANAVVIPDAYVIDELKKEEKALPNVVYLPSNDNLEPLPPRREEPKAEDSSFGAIIIEL